MPFKLVIDNKITTRVKGYYKDSSGISKPFNFELMQDRIDQDELKNIANDKQENASDVVRRVTHGWKGQRLVLDENDQPAAFSPEALDVLLSVAGMGTYCFQAYVSQVLVVEKN